MTPIVNGLSEEFEGRAAVLQLNATEPANEALLADYGLRGHPSFVVLDGNNQVVKRYFGPQSEDVLRQALVQVAATVES